ncbi:hypothetical protein KR084_010670 [Drosophila pseudotakahashii]|nr:hypothetical protein KR084_010670 [Drosophila pseudotakahashii]
MESRPEMKVKPMPDVEPPVVESMPMGRDQELNDLLVAELGCPVCYETILPPIKMCREGHLICAGCKAKVDRKCPVCQGYLGDVRSLAMEHVAEELMFPCSYFYMGCQARLTYAEKINGNHVKDCEWQPSFCPFSRKCCWHGPVKDVPQHQAESHKEEAGNSNESEAEDDEQGPPEVCSSQASDFGAP